MRLEGSLAVVTGTGDGMGRCLTVSLAQQGCSVAMCDVNLEAAEATRELAMKTAAAGVSVTCFRCDVSNQANVQDFVRHVAASHKTAGRGFLLFNNAGIGGGGSFVTDSRETWERCFNVCWGGCYNNTRAFMPLLLAAPAGHIVNTSSTAGFWAGGFLTPGVAYASAKFAIKGFTEALINDLRLNAPHVRVSLVMPGQIGTGGQMGLHMGQYGLAPLRALYKKQAERLAEMKRANDPQYVLLQQTGELARVEAVAARGELSDEAMAKKAAEFKARFRASPQTTAEVAAEAILNGVKADEWRILVGQDAIKQDEDARARPLELYDAGFPAQRGKL